jgi:hypothetical protein
MPSKNKIIVLLTFTLLGFIKSYAQTYKYYVRATDNNLKLNLVSLNKSIEYTGNDKELVSMFKDNEISMFKQAFHLRIDQIC